MSDFAIMNVERNDGGWKHSQCMAAMLLSFRDVSGM